MRTTGPAATALTRFADAISAHDWSTFRATLADDFTATLLHTGEVFDADGFVAFTSGYPGDWTYGRDEVVDGGQRAVLRSRTVIGDQTWHAASFGSVDADGRLTELVEVWAEPVASPLDRAR